MSIHFQSHDTDITTTIENNPFDFISFVVPMAPSVLEALNDTMKVGVVHGAQRFSFGAHLVLGKSRTTFSGLFDFVNRSLKKIDRPLYIYIQSIYMCVCVQIGR